MWVKCARVNSSLPNMGSFHFETIFHSAEVLLVLGGLQRFMRSNRLKTKIQKKIILKIEIDAND